MSNERTETTGPVSNDATQERELLATRLSPSEIVALRQIGWAYRDNVQVGGVWFMRHCRASGDATRDGLQQAFDVLEREKEAAAKRGDFEMAADLRGGAFRLQQIAGSVSAPQKNEANDE